MDYAGSLAVSRESQRIGPVRVVIRPHRIHHAFGVTATDHLLHAAYEHFRRDQIVFYRGQLRDIAIHVRHGAQAARSALVLDEAVAQKHVAEIRALPQPCLPLLLAACRLILRAELTGRCSAAQMRVALRPRRGRAKALYAGPIQILEFVGRLVADIDDLAHLVQNSLQIHTLLSLIIRSYGLTAVLYLGIWSSSLNVPLREGR